MNVPVFDTLVASKTNRSVLEVYYLDFCLFLDLKRYSYLKNYIPDLRSAHFADYHSKELKSLTHYKLLASLLVIWDLTVYLVL